ncbi:MAG TPA: hypothetical protein DF613_00815, partial [Lachnospiraceae bacterium]|nr:hypothetical protein [Lachnospiraceae bacterium]
MSKIKAVRLINLNYNNNAIKISDETFHMNGESTLLSLRNGGGKSVLVQMLAAPFVHKRYRDAKDRPFTGYFTTPKPTFILVEWELDQEAGCVTTGMMVRKSQSLDGEGEDGLEMVNFISEYREPCRRDLRHLPVVEKGKREMTLKSFAACRQIFEEFKREDPSGFFYYDMAGAAQSRQYFDKLREYRIYYREWETIIKKINLEESGLSNLFADCRDERGLVEKWFLDAVESKLNQGQNRIKEFQSIVGKYVGQYKDNQSKIKRRDTIRLFKEEGCKIKERALQYQAVEEKRAGQENRIAAFIGELGRLKEETAGKLRAVEEELSENQRAIGRVQYEKLSGEYHRFAKKRQYHLGSRELLGMEQEALEREEKGHEEHLHLLFCARQQDTAERERADLEEVRQKLLVCRRKTEDLAPERDYLGYMLHRHYEAALAENEAKREKLRSGQEQTKQSVRGWQEKIREAELALRANASREGELKNRVGSYDEKEELFNRRYGAELTRNILGRYEPGTLENQEETDRRELEEETRAQRRRQRRLEDGREKSRSLRSALEALDREKREKQWEKARAEKLREDYDRELAERLAVLKYLDLDEADRFDTEKILRTSERKLREIDGIRSALVKEEDELQKEYRRLTQGRVLELPGELQQEFVDRGIRVAYGMEWLKKNGYSEERNRKIVKNHPLLPYALILSGKDLEKLSDSRGSVYTSFPVPVIRREILEEQAAGEARGNIVSFPQISFYVLFNENLLSEEKLALLVREAELAIEQKQEAIAIRNREYTEYFERKEAVRNQKVSRRLYAANEEAIKTLEENLRGLAAKRDDAARELKETEETAARLEKEIREAERGIDERKRRREDFSRLREDYGRYEEDCRKLDRCRGDGHALEEKKALAADQLARQQDLLEQMKIEAGVLAQAGQKLMENAGQYAGYGRLPEVSVEAEVKELDIAGMEARFGAITASLSQEMQGLENQEQKARRRFEADLRELGRLQKKYAV